MRGSFPVYYAQELKQEEERLFKSAHVCYRERVDCTVLKGVSVRRRKEAKKVCKESIYRFYIY